MMENFVKEGLFPYCDDSFVAWSYREHLLLDEIIGYKPSLLALQELDSKRYKANFGRTMKDEGYESFYSNKSASPEGVCLFWKSDEFELKQKRDYPINGALLDKDESLFKDLQEAIESCKP